MTRSANEVMNLAAKAARGAGAPPGQAADFGRAALCHLVAGRAPSDLEQALKALPSGPILSLPLALARVLETTQKGAAQGVVPCAGTTALCLSYAEALPYAQNTRVEADSLHLNIDTSTPASRMAVTRVELPEDLATLMAQHAARTFVPESDASRLAGAGAGLTDND